VNLPFYVVKKSQESGFPSMVVEVGQSSKEKILRDKVSWWFGGGM
jgi:hypothetical protein